MLIHVVQKGDTVWNLAKKYGVSVSRILADNGLTESSVLVVGQALIITLPAMVYTVRRGDTLTSIADGYGVTVMELYQNNPGLVGGTLQPGQVITISFQGDKIRTIAFSGYAFPHISRSLLLQALPFLTYLTVFAYGIKESGELITVDDSDIIALCYQYRCMPLMSLSTIKEGSGFSTETATLVLTDAEIRSRVLNNVVAVMKEKGYLGLDVDFEYIEPSLRDEYTAFLKEAADLMHENGFILSTDLAPKISADQPGFLYGAHDYPAIGAVADQVFLMTYEWGYTFGPPMAVSPLNMVRAVLRYAVSAIPREKILMGIPNYGYDWKLPFERGTSVAVSLGNEGAVALAAKRHAAIQFDEKAASPWYNYWVGTTQHVVWFEDVRSIQAKLALSDEFGIKGVGYWNLMRPFAQNWAFISTRYGVSKVI